MGNKYKNINTITVSSDTNAFKDRCGGKVTKIKTAAVIDLLSVWFLSEFADGVNNIDKMPKLSLLHDVEHLV